MEMMKSVFLDFGLSPSSGESTRKVTCVGNFIAKTFQETVKQYCVLNGKHGPWTSDFRNLKSSAETKQIQSM